MQRARARRPQGCSALWLAPQPEGVIDRCPTHVARCALRHRRLGVPFAGCWPVGLLLCLTPRRMCALDAPGPRELRPQPEAFSRRPLIKGWTG